MRGFVLLIAIIFMSVMLSFALALGSLGYKQHLLTSAAIDSQYAFYAADSALECALYVDQKLDGFSHADHSGAIEEQPDALSCGGVGAERRSYSYDSSVLIESQRVVLSDGEGCADITVYKQSSGETDIFSQGYNVSCETLANPGSARMISRGIRVHY